MRYAQTYTKLGEYRERAVGAVQGQEGNSFVSDLIGLLRLELAIGTRHTHVLLSRGCGRASCPCHLFCSTQVNDLCHLIYLATLAYAKSASRVRYSREEVRPELHQPDNDHGLHFLRLKPHCRIRKRCVRVFSEQRVCLFRFKPSGQHSEWRADRLVWNYDNHAYTNEKDTMILRSEDRSGTLF